jgi:predicted nucleotidyltransferase component of viral defense system
VHNIKRFSEDLDFETNSMRLKEFESSLTSVTKELSRLGMKLDLKFKHWGRVYSSKLIFKDIEKQYNIVSKHSKKEGIIIKVETCNVGYKIKTQPQMLAGFGEFFPCICLTEGVVFANKIDTFLKKERGRHLYDLMFMLSKKFPIEKLVLKHLGIKQSPSEVILKRVEDLPSSILKKMAENLRPFLFEEVEADMLLRAKELLPALLSA